MKVTRDVVYDLLPAYFAGEVSADTRSLIKEFFATDPEFGRMAEKFGALMEERARRGSEDTEADRERTALNRAIRRSRLRQASLAWALATVLALVMAGLTPIDGGVGLRHPGIIIGIVFGAMALGTWLVSYRPDSARWFGAFFEK
jgi:anti-sigma factor RsiW